MFAKTNKEVDQFRKRAADLSDDLADFEESVLTPQEIKKKQEDVEKEKKENEKNDFIKSALNINPADLILNISLVEKAFEIMIDDKKISSLKAFQRKFNIDFKFDKNVREYCQIKYNQNIPDDILINQFKKMNIKNILCLRSNTPSPNLESKFKTIVTSAISGSVVVAGLSATLSLKAIIPLAALSCVPVIGQTIAAGGIVGIGTFIAVCTVIGAIAGAVGAMVYYCKNNRSKDEFSNALVMNRERKKQANPDMSPTMSLAAQAI